MENYDTIDSRNDAHKAFEALKASTPIAFAHEFGRMMLMGRKGSVHDFKHSDKRRGFSFDIETGQFSGICPEGPISTAEQAYAWACS